MKVIPEIVIACGKAEAKRARNGGLVVTLERPDWATLRVLDPQALVNAVDFCEYLDRETVIEALELPTDKDVTALYKQIDEKEDALGDAVRERDKLSDELEAALEEIEDLKLRIQEPGGE